MSPETAIFLLRVLESVTLSAGDPNFEEVAASITAARRELLALSVADPEQSSS